VKPHLQWGDTKKVMQLAGGRPPKAVAGNRRCAANGCAVRLSRYNRSDRCSVHGGWGHPPIAEHLRDV
jgi:hypothetical protein